MRGYNQTMNITNKIRAALFAKSLIDSPDASDAVCRDAVYAAVGTVAGLSEQQVIMAIMSAGSGRVSAGPSVPAPRYDSLSRSAPEGAERFAADVVDALLVRSGFRADRRVEHGLQSMPMMEIARRSMLMCGHHVPDFITDPQDLAMKALQMGGLDRHTVGATSSYGRPGDFPNLLSNLAGKILDQALDLATVTYPLWTARLPDLASFNAKTIIGLGMKDELDEILDDDETQPIQHVEEVAGWIQAGRYGNKVGLTPVMLVDDDLDAFTQGLQSLAMAHEHTLNRLCVALLASNVTLLDGYSLFDETNHSNEVTSGNGGAPSTTQTNKMRLLHRRQTGIGGFGKVGSPPAIALVPTAHEEAALQTYMPFALLAESKVPVTDATINVWRGTVTPVVEPELEEYSTAIWYTFADPRLRRCVCHAFMRGYGRGGKRTNWFDPSKKTMYYDVEGQFAAAICGHRGAVRNAGA